MNGVNNAPVNTVPASTSTPEDAGLSFSAAAGNALSVSDDDLGAGNLALTLAVTNGTLTLSGITGLTFTAGSGTGNTTMTCQGTLASINAALNGLAFAPTANFNGTATLTMTSNDLGGTGVGGAMTTIDNVSIVVTAVNDPPVLNAQTFSVAENSANGAVVGTVLASDVDNATLSYSSTTGNTGGAFALNASTGQLTVATVALLDYETTPSYSLTVQVSDGTAATTATVTVNLTNVVEIPTISSFSTAAELPGQVVVLTGTKLTAASSVRFGGVPAGSVTYTSPTSLTATVPVTATTGSSSVVVTTADGSSTSSPAFEVLQVYRSPAASGCLATASATVNGTGGSGVWRYLRLAGAGGDVVAAIEDTYDLGTVTAGFTALGTSTSSPVRTDGHHQAYLDRNVYLTATNQTFPGQSVRVRFFGLSSELARLQAADASATATTLKVSQYRGANENCTLSDNSTTGERRLLAAPATTLSGADWFTAEVLVADHFSEFYLTGAATPLPVQLVHFTATASGRTVRLDWATASEQNSARFEAERSVDGRQYQQVGEVAAAGSSATPHTYALTDAALPVGPALLYYRLRQVDQNGPAAYSPVRSVAVGSTALGLFPNPAQGGTTVAGLPAGAGVAVYDALGRRRLTATANADGTAWLAGLATGMYVVRSGRQALRLSVE